MHGLAVYVKEGLLFARDLTLENSMDSYFCFRLALLHSLSFFFILYCSPSSSLCMVFDSISFNRNEVLLINPSANVFVFRDLNVHHKGWLTYVGGTERHGELCYIFVSQMTFFFFFNWYSLHARLNSHYEAWSYKKRKHKKVKAYRESI